MSADPVERVLTLLAEGGHGRYDGEAVTQLEHALQCAAAAEKSGAAPALVAAALLHDVGHLLHAEEREPEADRAHEALGARYLERWFAPELVEPVRLHVAAKRYLCSAEAGYLDSLSEASRHSLELQGGPLAESEARGFLERRGAPEAVALRRWDDAAKVVGAITPPLEHFRTAVSAALRRDRVR